MHLAIKKGEINDRNPEKNIVPGDWVGPIVRKDVQNDPVPYTYYKLKVMCSSVCIRNVSFSTVLLLQMKLRFCNLVKVNTNLRKNQKTDKFKAPHVIFIYHIS